MLKKALEIPDLSNRIIIITGANAGLGLESTRLLAKNHATVIMACRDMEKGNSARNQLIQQFLR